MSETSLSCSELKAKLVAIDAQIETMLSKPKLKHDGTEADWSGHLSELRQLREHYEALYSQQCGASRIKVYREP